MIPATDIERARAVRIEDEIARRGITLKRVGTEMIGPCAVCGGRDRFAINLIIAALQDRGQWPADQQLHKTFRPPPGQPLHDQRHHDAERTTRALSIWRSATPACGTSVETYLRPRGIVAPIPATLRFHSELPHPSGGNWPSVIARVTRADEEPIAVLRTLLSRIGTGKAPIEPERMILERCRGGAVRLGTAQPGQWLVIGKGIEMTLSVTQLPGWAALSAMESQASFCPARRRWC
jgi:putative DNA primase/helicase